mmetsp:Transcript_14633/g.40663  ORF Transcript_14633/g.40663 Transcript_14633/m.40663 type:complete len:289 (+) Transcript_14633:175-1041(+)|eukprot:CAMPEP_0172368612 /NCGR_PEP_ID=MMETSP1060-20121228/28211_1 /TAXON_ID=37318 /ORGANISM="Pseudo-nitzschia pungens, Strain cf. cingulata" /LENGTH=288 /DNA_ID=CAMNT_0013093257 /DNA_START=111 /DNA_END=977 /DNA_ORIENTATION=+
MATRRTIALSLLCVCLQTVSLSAWAPTKTFKNGLPTTALYANELAPSKRRFAQARTQKQPYGADSKLGSLHKERLKTAGRKGTKRFVDPCKVFVGNLPFDVDKHDLAQFILDTMGQNRMILHSFKVIEDWKTGKSKGYGFVEFTDPIFATVCMDVCNGKMLNGRPVKISQGKKREEEDQVFIKKRKKAETEEDKAISSALDEAENDTEELEIDDDGVAIFDDINDEDLELDAMLFGLDLDDDDEQDDGVFLERGSKYEYDEDENLNREQRRDAARRRKKKKLPSKGFG